MIGWIARYPHLERHLRPIIIRLKEMGLPVQEGPGDITLTAAKYDADRPGRVVLLEHGAGQTYRTHNEVIDAGGHLVLNNVVLYLGPNERTCAVMKESVPYARRVVVGSPVVEWMSKQARDPQRIGFTVHWPSPLASRVLEAGTSWPDSAYILKALPEPKVAHCHPRGEYRFRRDLLRRHIKVGFVPDWDALWPTLSVLVVDNSSVLWEAAAVGIDVAVIHPRLWTGRHGLRFGEEADPLLRVTQENAADIMSLEKPPPAGSPYALIDGATEAAAQAILLTL